MKKNLYKHMRTKHNKEPNLKENVMDLKDIKIKELEDEIKFLKEKLAFFENNGKKELISATELNSVPEEKPKPIIKLKPKIKVEPVSSEQKEPVSSVENEPVSSKQNEPASSKEIKEKTGLETIPEEPTEWKTMHFHRKDGTKLMGLIKPKIEIVGIDGKWPEVQRIYSKKPETKSVIENLIGYLEKDKSETRTIYIQNANRLIDCNFKLPEELSELSGCELYSNSYVDDWTFKL
jgi:hypothetical protein